MFCEIAQKQIFQLYYFGHIYVNIRVLIALQVLYRLSWGGQFTCQRLSIKSEAKSSRCCSAHFSPAYQFSRAAQYAHYYNTIVLLFDNLCLHCFCLCFRLIHRPHMLLPAVGFYFAIVCYQMTTRTRSATHRSNISYL